MGNLVSRVFEGPIPDHDFDVKEYQTTLKRRGRAILGLATGIFIVAGFKLSGSILIALGIGLIPVFVLWKGHNAAWKDIQPEFVTKEWDSCVVCIHNTIQNLSKRHQENYVFKYPVFINLPLLAVYHIHHQSFAYEMLHYDSSYSDECFDDAYHYMKFASSAYGAVYMRFLKIIKEFPIKAKDDIDAKAISIHTGVPVSDIFAMELTGVQVNCPAYFVTVDHRKQAVVITVRGTSNIGDVMTDLVCKSVHFLDGVAHEGIKTGAEKLFKKTVKLVCSLLGYYKDYSLMLTGHSLGAGTSILLTMLYLDFHRNQDQRQHLLIGDELLEATKDLILPRNLKIHCYAFAPPPVFGTMGQEMPQLHDEIDVYVNHCDIVPRLSLASFNDMLHALQRIDDLDLNLRERIGVFFFAITHPLITKIIEKVRSVIEDTNFSNLLSENDSHFQRLFIPGRIHLMQKATKGKRYVVRRKNSNFFSHMLLVDGFFADHLPDQYENAISAICQSNIQK